MSRITYRINEMGEWVAELTVNDAYAYAAPERHAPGRVTELPETKAATMPPAGLVITRAESFPFQDFLSKKIGAAGPDSMRKDTGLPELAPADVAGKPVASTALHFSDKMERPVLLAPSSDPDTVPEQPDALQSLLRNQESRERRPFIA